MAFRVQRVINHGNNKKNLSDAKSSKILNNRATFKIVVFENCNITYDVFE